MAGGESGRSAEPSYGRGSRATILGQHGKVWVQGLSMRLLLSVALATFVGLAAAHGQVYPSRPVTMIVPFPAGGSTDAIARILAERMRVSLGQPVVIENVGGAGGSIGVGRVARGAGRLHPRRRPMGHPCRERRNFPAFIGRREGLRAGRAAFEQSVPDPRKESH